jgi:hypothetical protein
MLDSLFENPFPYTTTARVEQVLEDDLDRADPGLAYTIAEFNVNSLGYRAEQRDGKLIHHYATRTSRQAQADSLFRACLNSLEDTAKHVELMDEAFSSLITCHFRPTRQSHEIAECVCQILSRLPSTPLEIRDISDRTLMKDIPAAYFLPGREKNWETLQLVRHVSRNILRIALWSVMSPSVTVSTGEVHDFSEIIAELFELSLDRADDIQPKWMLFLVRVFLWAQWQRCIMINSYSILKYQLQAGCDTDIPSQILKSRMTSGLVQGFDRPPGAFKIEVIHPQPVPYVCKWALRLLQTDRGAISFDLRRLFERYAQLFGHLPPRCKISGGEMAQCSGVTLYDCNRFVGMKIEDQTAHSTSCDGNCCSLYWDELSYRDTEGARAVSLDGLNRGLLQYCSASDRTMAISHVWSHGQGGRPELGTSGLNSCLHDRYVKIAKSYGCDSYWMDTPCIPQDHTLRREAIEQINSVFAKSRLTLVCDRDLMSIQVENLTIELQESILASILLCDWNVRAWTLLEALRGRKNIQILFANDEIISLKDTLRNVQREGSIDLAILYLTAQHLLPAPLNPPGAKQHKYWYRNETERNGAFSIEQAAALMHLRHASRRGDEIVIWSLLCNDKVPRPIRKPKLGAGDLPDVPQISGDGVEEVAVESLDEDSNASLAEAFWRMRIGYSFNTGFLMSSAPRAIQHKGFTWAPSRPALPPPAPDKHQAKHSSVRDFMPFDGRDTMWGTIMPWGFIAAWLVHIFKTRESASSNSDYNFVKPIAYEIQPDSCEIQMRLGQISATFLKEDFWGALLQPLGSSNGLPAKYRGHCSGTLLAIVGSRDLSVWKWRGLYDWDKFVPLPEMDEEEIVLV